MDKKLAGEILNASNIIAKVSRRSGSSWIMASQVIYNMMFENKTKDIRKIKIEKILK